MGTVKMPVASERDTRGGQSAGNKEGCLSRDDALPENQEALESRPRQQGEKRPTQTVEQPDHASAVSPVVTETQAQARRNEASENAGHEGKRTPDAKARCWRAQKQRANWPQRCTWRAPGQVLGPKCRNFVHRGHNSKTRERKVELMRVRPASTRMAARGLPAFFSEKMPPKRAEVLLGGGFSERSTSWWARVEPII